MRDVDGTCDGTMVFDAQSTSVFGGGLQSLRVTTHTVLRFWGAVLNAAARANSRTSPSTAMSLIARASVAQAS